MTFDRGARPPGTTFVGRARELAELESALSEAVDGRGGMVLVGGEPGIGKSRLTDELADLAHRTSFRVVWGRCWEAGGAPPHWPWVQAIRTLLRDEDPAEAAALLGAGAPDIAQIVPEVREVLPGVADPPHMDPDSARFRLFDAVAGFLRRVAARQPLLVIIEDLHAADPSSLLLLRFAARELADARLVLAGTYRTTEVAPGDPIAEAASDLGRLPASRRLLLSGLPEADVGELIESVTDGPPDPGVTHAIHRETEGNPLFVGEVVRLLMSEGRLAEAGARGAGAPSIPQGVRDVIGQRLLRLSDACTGLLTLAAILGRDFALEPLRRLAGRSLDEVLEILEEASAARVVTEVPSALGWRRFSHALIREALYEDLSATQRVRLHRTAGVVLEEMHAADLEPHLAQLAHHFAQAAPVGESGRAVKYARAAAEQALQQLAFEEAVRLYRIALDALEVAAPVDEPSRCDLLVALADAQARGGDLAGARPVFLRAADLARRLELPEHLARAAIGYGGRIVWGRAGSDPHMVSLLEDALAALGDDHPRIRVRVQARLAGALRTQPDPDRRERLAREAVEIARTDGDPATLAYALDGLFGAIWGVDTLEERRAITGEIVRWAREARDREREVDGRLAGAMAAAEVGDLLAVRAAIEGSRPITSELQQPAYRWFVDSVAAVIAIAEGRLDAAAELIEEAGRLGRRSMWDAGTTYLMHRYMLRSETGGVDELEAEIAEAVERYGGEYPMFTAALARLLAQQGRRDEAAAIVHGLAESGFAAIPRDNEWVFTLCLLAEAVDLLGDRERSRVLYELLSPFAERTAFGAAEGMMGSIETFLGILAGQTGRLDDAVAHLERGLEANARMGLRASLAWTRRRLAAILLARDAPGERDRAEAELSMAARAAAELGMSVLAGEIAALTRDTAVPSATADGARAALRREGEYWSISFSGDAFRLKDSKGLRHLSRMLAEPGREFHALDLVSGAPPGSSGPSAEEGLGVDSGEGAGPALDPQAKAEYRRRLEDLDSDLAEAEQAGDSGRAARARDERSAIAAELAGAVGLGGRDRPTASAAERARLNVTRALRSAVARIREHSPDLGAHLDRSVRTGTFCAYEPDPQSRVQWRL